MSKNEKINKPIAKPVIPGNNIAAGRTSITPTNLKPPKPK